jgi:hypothetical protein
MDTLVAWSAVGAIGSVAAAGIAAWAAYQSRSSAREANAAAGALAEIERDRRRSELMPRFRIVCRNMNDELGVPPEVQELNLRMWVTFLGPPGLVQLNSLTVRIRDYHFGMGGP